MVGHTYLYVCVGKEQTVSGNMPLLSLLHLVFYNWLSLLSNIILASRKVHTWVSKFLTKILNPSRYKKKITFPSRNEVSKFRSTSSKLTCPRQVYRGRAVHILLRQPAALRWPCLPPPPWVRRVSGSQTYRPSLGRSVRRHHRGDHLLSRETVHEYETCSQDKETVSQIL